MIRTRTIDTVSWILLTLVGLSGTGPASRAASPAPDLSTQQERQRQIKAETDRLVRRVQTMIRLLEYNRLNKTAEKQLLDQVAGTLSGLSREQMIRLIDALEKAGKVEGDARDEELLNVQARHEQIVLGLKGLLARFDAIKGLDQAAERLEKLARDELDHYLQNAQFAWEDENSSRPEIKAPDVRLRSEQLAGEQIFLHRDLSNLLGQLDELNKLLPPEHQERQRKLKAALRSLNLFDNLMTASRQLRSFAARPERQKLWHKAAEVQWQASGDIQDLASILRGPLDKLASLRQAWLLVERAIEEQEGVQQGTRTPPEKEKPDARPEEMPELYLLWARGLSSRQASLEFEARGIRALLQPHSKELAGKLTPVEKLMREAQTALRDQGLPRHGIDKALTPQEKAVEKLREIKDELERLLTEAEKAKNDPMANLQETLAKVEQLIKEQKDVRDKTDEAGKSNQTQRLPHLEPKQEDLAKRTEEINHKPSAAKPQTKKALEDAAKAMEQASKPLREQQAPPAVKKQDQALAKLEEAKKSLQEQVAEIEKRRDDIAKLEDADRKLDEMIKKESNVSDQAKKAEEKQAEELAKKQGELTPQAKDLGKDLEKSAPEASKHVQDSAKQMDAAKNDLQQKQLPPAAKKADKAVEKLKEAQKAVAKSLDEKKGKEAAEQAAMQPEVDPQNAAQQIAKALEETERAAKQSEQAQKEEKKPNADKAMAKSKSATNSAQAALAQARAQAPAVVQPQLQKAGQKLAQAGQDLDQGEAKPANADQKQAAEQLKQALDTLNSAVAQAGEKGEGESDKQGQSEGQGQGQGKPQDGQGQGQGQGQKPGQGQQPGQGQGKQPGKGQERNIGRGSGYRIADGQMNNSPSRPGDARGDGMFIHLPPRQRELIKQALNDKLPPEYAALIQQYYVNIARGKPASTPDKPKP